MPLLIFIVACVAGIILGFAISPYVIASSRFVLLTIAEGVAGLVLSFVGGLWWAKEKRLLNLFAMCIGGFLVGYSEAALIPPTMGFVLGFLLNPGLTGRVVLGLIALSVVVALIRSIRSKRQ